MALKTTLVKKKKLAPVANLQPIPLTYLLKGIPTPPHLQKVDNLPVIFSPFCMSFCCHASLFSEKLVSTYLTYKLANQRNKQNTRQYTQIYFNNNQINFQMRWSSSRPLSLGPA